MTTLPTILSRRVPRLSLLLTLTFALWLPSLAAEGTKLFDVPAGEAVETLRLAAQQAGKEIMFPADTVRGVQTAAVKGEFTPLAAFNRMLADTPLMVVQDEKTGAFAVSRISDPNGPRAVAMERDRPESKSKIEDGAVVLEDYAVTGSRIRGVFGEATVQPVYTYTRQDLDRFGAQSFADLQRYIPQLPLTDWNTQIETSFAGSPGAASGSLGFNDFGTGLRNLGGTATLVLVDGRRVPKLRQYSEGTASYDLSGIPLSAVERIEVLTDGASAVYGADALAGVVNIILKKEYRGTEINASYTNSFSTDTAERRVQLSHGFRTGKLSLNLSASWSANNTLAPRDRWWSATNDKRPWGGSDLRPVIFDAQGGIRSTHGGNLPGLNSPVAAIPVGSTGVGLTVADFANAPLPELLDSPKYTQYGSRVVETFSLSGSYAFRPWLEAFFNGGWNRNSTKSTSGGPAITRASLLSSRITLPGDYPGNPFGEPVYLERALWEFYNLMTTDFSVDSPNWLGGFRGQLGDWRYELAASKRWSRYSGTGYSVSTGGVGNIYPLLQSSITNPDPNARIILLNDSLSHIPHADNFYYGFMVPRDFREAPDVWLYDFKVDGPLWYLPAGAIQMAVGAEIQRDQANLGEGSTLVRLGGVFKREVRGVFAEMQIPIVSEQQDIPLLYRLALSISARSDSYSDFAGKTVPRYGLFYHPTKWLALRASYGEGYKIPTLHQLYLMNTATTGFGFFPAVLDPQRGGEPVSGPFQSLGGGNMDLRPEESRNINAGLVVDVPGVKGLSVSVDYYDLTHDQKITRPTGQMLLDSLPHRYSRGNPTAEDSARGWPGRIEFVDTRMVNIAYFNTTGFDVEARYNRSFGSLGDFMVRATATKPTRIVSRTTPTAPLVDTTHESSWRGTGMLFWNHGPLEAGTIVTYADSYMTAANITYDPVTLWDIQVGYDFGKASWRPQGRTRHVVGDTRLTVKVMNVFDKEPQTRLGSSLGNVDPRGRRYQIQYQRRF